MVLMGAAACTAFDVVLILRKGRQPVADCVVTADAERASEEPKVFTRIHLNYAVAGRGLNPAQVERQIAGSFVYGLSALFYGGCTVKDGKIEQTNFDTYNSMRIAEMPKVECVMVPSGGFWGGVGEPTIGVAAPAVLNAYFAATGKRIRSFPLKNHKIAMTA